MEYCCNNFYSCSSCYSSSENAYWQNPPAKCAGQCKDFWLVNSCGNTQPSSCPSEPSDNAAASVLCGDANSPPGITSYGCGRSCSVTLGITRANICTSFADASRLVQQSYERPKHADNSRRCNGGCQLITDAWDESPDMNGWYGRRSNLSSSEALAEPRYRIDDAI